MLDPIYSLVRPVFNLHEVVLDGAQKLLTKGAVNVPKVLECKRGCVVSIADGRCFGSGGACRDDGHCSRIRRGHKPCCREGRVDGGGKGEAKAYEFTASKVCGDRRRVRI